MSLQKAWKSYVFAKETLTLFLPLLNDKRLWDWMQIFFFPLPYHSFDLGSQISQVKKKKKNILQPPQPYSFLRNTWVLRTQLDRKKKKRRERKVTYQCLVWNWWVLTGPHGVFSALIFIQIPDTSHKFYFSSTERTYSNITVPCESDLQFVYTKDFSFAFCC